MSADFKPGDVAMVDSGGVEVVGICYQAGPALGDYDKRARWHLVDGDLVWSSVTSVRPLVVIDPESADDVGRLNVLIAKSGHNRGRLDLLREHTALAAALREYAAPTPPRPDEPTGLGAVVEDKLGRAWVRGPNGWTNLNATGRYLNWKHWDDADDPLSAAVVRILSPGVEVEA